MRFWLTLFTCFFIAVPVYAQVMDNYVPPALFDVKPEIQPDKKFKRDKLPMLSREVEDTSKPPQIRIEKVQSEQKVEKAKAKPKTKKVKPAPKPTKKPKAPSPKPAPAPIKIEPKKVTSQGVVKGPKTMPSVKKQGVESEVTFETDAKPTVLVNAAPIIEEPKTEAKPDKPKPAMVPISTQKDFSFDYQGSNDEITVLQQMSILEDIIPQLDMAPEARVIIQSYAPLLDNYETAAGRRIALSRALNIRKLLIDNEIKASRIDIRSMAADTPNNSVNLIKLKISE